MTADVFEMLKSNSFDPDPEVDVTFLLTHSLYPFHGSRSITFIRSFYTIPGSFDTEIQSFLHVMDTYAIMCLF